MSFDLSKAVKGSKVTFRCGGEAVVSDVGLKNCNTISFGHDTFWSYTEKGSFSNDKEPHPFDIIAIEPPEFDWSTVKPGMAFDCTYYGDHKLLIYVYKDGCDFIFRDMRISSFMENAHIGWMLQGLKGRMTRAPEHDIDVQS